MPLASTVPQVAQHLVSASRYRRILPVVVIFGVTLLILLLGMDRTLIVYDEGIALTGAMRVMAGKVPYRDFYFIYGPAQPYLLAELFRLFGPSVLVERLLELVTDAALAASVYAITRRYCNRLTTLLTTAVCVLWLFGLDIHITTNTPVLLLILVSTALLLPIFERDLSLLRLFAVGALVGLMTLFRHDAGIAITFIDMVMIVAAWLQRHSFPASRLRSICSAIAPYLLGFLVLVLPPLFAYLSVAPWHDLYFDLIGYPSQHYRASRSLPFPGIHLKTLDNLGVYLPVLIALLSIATILVNRPSIRRKDARSLPWLAFLFFFTTIVIVMYVKGLVRVSVNQAFLALLPSILVLAVLFEHRRHSPPLIRRLINLAMGLSVIAALWSGMRDMKFLYQQKASFIARVLSPSTQIPLSPNSNWCADPGPLTRGLCFVPDPDHIRTIEFLQAHTAPGDELYVGLPHHDRILINDSLTYFATQRMPATKWYHFDPDLQNTVLIQQQMIQDMEKNRPPYIALDSEFAQLHEPNDSSRSSGVFLLDDYIRQHYRLVQTFGEMFIWQRSS